MITEFALFGSILRDDFRPDSDVDVLVTFVPDAKWGLFKLVEMQQELETLVGRDVDLIERKASRAAIIGYLGKRFWVLQRLFMLSDPGARVMCWCDRMAVELGTSVSFVAVCIVFIRKGNLYD
jgi:predicted nucleotidyltransferase